jgi:hypothetical protein
MRQQKETIMSEGRRGNKEAKKPKKAPAKPVVPSGFMPEEGAAALPRFKK